MTAFFTSFWNMREQVLSLLLGHIELTFLSVGIAVLIGVPAGILITRSPGFSKPVLGVANVVEGIPRRAECQVRNEKAQHGKAGG